MTKLYYPSLRHPAYPAVSQLLPPPRNHAFT